MGYISNLKWYKKDKKRLKIKSNSSQIKDFQIYSWAYEEMDVHPPDIVTLNKALQKYITYVLIIFFSLSRLSLTNTRNNTWIQHNRAPELNAISVKKKNCWTEINGVVVEGPYLGQLDCLIFSLYTFSSGVMYNQNCILHPLRILKIWKKRIRTTFCKHHSWNVAERQNIIQQQLRSVLRAKWTSFWTVVAQNFCNVANCFVYLISTNNNKKIVFF